MIPTGMVDIHTHILPGIDDGPDDLRESVAMAKIAYREGIGTVVCTPHAKKDYDVLITRAQHGLQLLQKEIELENIPITLILGFEVLVCDAVLTYKHLKKMAFCLNGQAYMLMEFDFYRFPAHVNEFIARLREEGITPILAHPERYQYMLGNITFLENLTSSGVLLQINTRSITGAYGKTVQKFAKKIIQNGLAGFIATDAHSTGKRSPCVKKAGRIVQSWAPSASLETMYYHSV